jgi:glutamyl-tRNA reductase
VSTTSDGRGTLLLVGLSRRTAPLHVIERGSVDAPGARRLLHALRNTHAVEEAFVLSTCDRTELYAVPRQGEVVDAIRLGREVLAGHTHVSNDELAQLGYARSDAAAVEHFFGVAAGLDSTVLGESEIVAQVRAAVALAREEGMLDRVLGGLSEHGLAAGRRIRAKTAISRGTISIPSIAVDLAETLVGDLGRRRALVIGAGRIGRSVAQHLASRGAEIVVASRSVTTADAIAREVGGGATGLGLLPEELGVAELVVCASAAPSFLVPKRMLEAAGDRRERPLIVIDVAMPRDVEPAAHELTTVVLRDIDDIRQLAEAHLDDRRAELGRARSIVLAETERFDAWRTCLAVEPLLTEIRRRAELVRAHEVARAARDAALGEDDLARLDAITRSLVKKLLHDPTERVRRASGTPGGRAQLRALEGLLGVASGERSAEPPYRARLSLVDPSTAARAAVLGDASARRYRPNLPAA